MEEQQSKNQFPNIATWVEEGTIEIGSGYRDGIVVRAIDEGGVVFEAKRLKNFEHAINTLEKGIKSWCKENF